MLNPKLQHRKGFFSTKYFIPYSISSVLFLILISFLFFNLFYWGKIFPGIKVAGVDVGGLYPEQAEVFLKEEISIPEVITLISDKEEFRIGLEEINHTIDFKSSILSAYHRYRTGNVLYDTANRLRLFKHPTNIGVVNTVDDNAVEQHLSAILGQIETEPIEPSLDLMNGEVLVAKGAKGKKVNAKKLRAEIDKSLSLLNYDKIIVPVIPVGNILAESKITLFESMGKAVIGKSINLQYDLYKKGLSDKELIRLLDFDNIVKKSDFEVLLKEVKSEIEREPQNSILTFEGGKVQEFVPSKDGVTVDETVFFEKFVVATRDLINTKIETITVEMPVTIIAPEIRTEDVNNLGIKKLIGRGTSRFSGSISSRIYNIGVASSKFNGVLVKPNETVSFNNILGDVSALTGYKQAYIIKDGKTVLGDGGGVCQVSTTLFRAVLDAGLPITERRAHSYRVGYYEQDSPVGLDATVYAPTTDFKFKNDTGNHLLIQTEFFPNKSILIYEIYGTSDGRVATISKPVVSSVSPPPEDLYIDDPTLPIGTIKQIDYKAWGAKAYFTYTVERDGEVIIEKSFYSNYQPWQAKFLQGTAPVI